VEGKIVSQSRIVMARTMQPTDANAYGNVHGGAIMRFVDEAGGAVAIRHARSRAVTASLDHMSFEAPAHIGDLVTVTAFLTHTGRSSMEVACEVVAENFVTGEVRLISRCYVVYVAIDEQGRPIPVPPLICETDEERARWQEAEERRTRRPRH
jgi:acyl-CoA hydrolase